MKCDKCHDLVSTFPSSRDFTATEQNHVKAHENTTKISQVMLKYLMVVHPTGILSRGKHKLACMFDMPPPASNESQIYQDIIKSTVINAVNITMVGASKHISSKVDSFAALLPTQPTLR